MIFRQLDSAHDWTFGKGLSNYAQTEKAVEANIQTRLLSWANDCFFALASGVDWLSLLDVGQQNNMIEAIKSNILNAFGVVGVNSVEAIFDAEARHINITYNIQTIYSPSFAGQIVAGAGLGGTNA